MIRPFIAVAALLSLMGSSLPASATTFPAVGGFGDAAAVDTCPAGMYLIGLKGRTGSWVDQVQIVCAPVTPAVYGTGSSNQNPVSGGTGAGMVRPHTRGGGGAPAENRVGIWRGGYWRRDPCLNSRQASGLGVPSMLVSWRQLPTSSRRQRFHSGIWGTKPGPGIRHSGTNNCPAGVVRDRFPNPLRQRRQRHGPDLRPTATSCPRRGGATSCSRRDQANRRAQNPRQGVRLGF